jgi:hypothetical protein
MLAKIFRAESARNVRQSTGFYSRIANRIGPLSLLAVSSPNSPRLTALADQHHPNSDKLDIFYPCEVSVRMQADIFSQPDGICHQAVGLVAITSLELTNRELSTLSSRALCLRSITQCH